MRTALLNLFFLFYSLITPVAGKISRAKAPDYTHKESQYLQRLAEQGRTVRVCMNGGDVFEGRVEFFDAAFIRLTRDGEPNLFLYKQDMKYLVELDPPKSA